MRPILICLVCLFITAPLSANTMVIITPREFGDLALPLMDHKNRHGILIGLKTTEAIYQEYVGRDEPEKIKLFIKDAVENYGVKYVLLMGGRKRQSQEWLIPPRYVNLNDGFKYSVYMSDLYYADLYKANGAFEDWDSNQDNVFAQWGKDKLDLKPDVHVGRLPCRARWEVKNVVEKIIHYENNTKNKKWFNTMVTAGGDTFPGMGNKFPFEGEATCDVALGFMKKFQPKKIYISNGNLKHEPDVINAINQGCGFVMTRGKGSQDRVRIPWPAGHETVIFHNNYLCRLKNKNRLPVTILGQCYSAKFDVCASNVIGPNIQAIDCIPSCLAWALVGQTPMGAIAVCSNNNTCYGVPGVDQNKNGIVDDAERFGGFLAVEFFRIHGDQGVDILGEVFSGTINSYISKFKVHQDKLECKSVTEWTLIGDPSLKIGGY